MAASYCFFVCSGHRPEDWGRYEAGAPDLFLESRKATVSAPSLPLSSHFHPLIVEMDYEMRALVGIWH